MCIDLGVSHNKYRVTFLSQHVLDYTASQFTLHFPASSSEIRHLIGPKKPVKGGSNHKFSFDQKERMFPNPT